LFQFAKLQKSKKSDKTDFINLNYVPFDATFLESFHPCYLSNIKQGQIDASVASAK